MHQLKIAIILLLSFCYAGESYARLRLCPGDFGVEGEWLYFLPSVDHPFYAAEGAANLQTGNFNNELLDNPFKFSSGYRVGGGFAFCDIDLLLEVHWTHLRTSSKDASSGDPSVVTLSQVDNLSATNTRVETNAHFSYHSVEGSVGKPLCSHSCLDVVLHLGVEHTKQEVRQEVSARGLNNFIFSSIKTQKKSTLEGTGPKFRLDGAYLIGCGLSVAGKVDTALLISRVEATRRELIIARGQQATNTQNFQIGTDKIWRLVPEGRLRMGLAYEACFCNVGLSGEAGYEFLTYINAHPFFFADRNTIRSVTDYSDLCMHGLYVNLALKY